MQPPVPSLLQQGKHQAAFQRYGGTVMGLPFGTALDGKKVFLRVGSSDFRRGIRGMVSLVVVAMDLQMDEQSLFVFCSTSRKQIPSSIAKGQDAGF